jgi:hypothetical protein
MGASNRAGKPDALHTLRAALETAGVLAKRVECGELAPAFGHNGGRSVQQRRQAEARSIRFASLIASKIILHIDRIYLHAVDRLDLRR